MQVGELDFSWIVSGGDPVKGVARRTFLRMRKRAEVEVGPTKADLQDKVQIGWSAFGSDQKAPPEHWVDPPNLDVDKVSFGVGIVFMTEPAYQMGDVSALASAR